MAAMTFDQVGTPYPVGVRPEDPATASCGVRFWSAVRSDSAWPMKCVSPGSCDAINYAVWRGRSDLSGGRVVHANRGRRVVIGIR